MREDIMMGPGGCQLHQWAEDEEDVRKIYQELYMNNVGNSIDIVHIPWTPYQWMTYEDLCRYIRLGMPINPRGGNWDHVSLAEYDAWWRMILRWIIFWRW